MRKPDASEAQTSTEEGMNMAVSGSLPRSSIPGHVDLINQERGMIEELESKWDLSYPPAVRILLNRLRETDIFKTHVGLCFLSSLERRLKEDKRDNRPIIIIFVLSFLVVLLCVGIIALPLFIHFG